MPNDPGMGSYLSNLGPIGEFGSFIIAVISLCGVWGTKKFLNRKNSSPGVEQSCRAMVQSANAGMQMAGRAMAELQKRRKVPKSVIKTEFLLFKAAQESLLNAYE